MKKQIEILSILISSLSLIAFGVIDWNDQRKTPGTHNITEDIQKEGETDEKTYVDFFYNVDSRFRGMTKADVDKARSLHDFLSERMRAQIVSYQSLSVIILADNEEKEIAISETAYGDFLSFAQINLLQSSNYSTNFYIRADYQEKNSVTGALEDGYTTPYLTIVPKKQAKYIDGKDALLDYLSDHNKDNTANLNLEKLQAAKLYFTVNKNGTISNVRLAKPSGYPAIDQTMIELISNTPGKWAAAEDEKGEKVNQELVVSFGIIGC